MAKIADLFKRLVQDIKEMPKALHPETLSSNIGVFVSWVKKIDPKKLNPKDIALAIKNFKIDPAVVKKNYLWIAVGVLVFALIMAKTVGSIKEAFFGGKKEKGKETVEFAETIPVKVYKVKLMDFKDTLPAMGRIEGFREIELRFDSKGVIESFNFEEGEKILEGDIIATLDQKDALLKLKYANLELEKTKKMFELGGVAKLALDQKQLEYESAKRDLEKTNIYAPSDGYLASREKDPGTFVMSQDKIGSFVDFSQVYAVFDIIEEDSPKIKVGQKVEIFLDAYPGESYSGTVDMIAPMIEGRTRTQKVKVELANEEGKLKPGMFSRAIINTYEKKEALIIPASAFKKKENQYFVYVVHPEEGEQPEGEGADAKEGATGKDKEKDKKKTEVAKEKDKAKETAKKPSREEEMAGGEEQAPGEEAPAEGGPEAQSEEAKTMAGVVEEREIGIEYLTHDMAEISKGLKEGELIIRELHQEYKDKDKVEITEVQESIF